MDAPKTNTDYTAQNTLDTTRFWTGNNTTPNLFGITTGLKIFEYLQTKGLLTQTEIEALNTLTLPQYYMIGGQLEIYTVTYIRLATALYCRDSTNTIDINLPYHYAKQTFASWSAGNMSGCVDTGSIQLNTTYFIYAIAKTDGTSDMIISLSKVSPALPTDYIYYRLIGAIYGGISGLLKIYQLNDLNFDFSFKNVIPYKYFEGYELSLDAYNNLIISKGQTKDVGENYDIENLENWQKALTPFAVGNSNGCLSGTLTINTLYYIYAIINLTSRRIDFFATDTTLSLPSGYNTYKLIGFLQVLDTTSNLFVWNFNEKWDDINFDLTSSAKTTEVDAPTYTDLFGDGIKIATFATNADKLVSLCKEPSHKVRENSPIRFHGHIFPEAGYSGDVVFEINYEILNETDVISSAKSQTSIVTIADGDGHTYLLFDYILNRAIEPGTQVRFSFARKGTDVADTFGGAIGVTTVGFHCIHDKRGSDIEYLNI